MKRFIVCSVIQKAGCMFIFGVYGLEELCWNVSVDLEFKCHCQSCDFVIKWKSDESVCDVLRR